MSSLQSSNGSIFSTLVVNVRVDCCLGTYRIFLAFFFFYYIVSSYCCSLYMEVCCLLESFLFPRLPVLFGECDEDERIGETKS